LLPLSTAVGNSFPTHEDHGFDIFCGWIVGMMLRYSTMLEGCHVLPFLYEGQIYVSEELAFIDVPSFKGPYIVSDKKRPSIPVIRCIAMKGIGKCHCGQNKHILAYLLTRTTTLSYLRA
jgi:hypothetical protein